jgi:hypothetical protein
MALMLTQRLRISGILLWRVLDLVVLSIHMVIVHDWRLDNYSTFGNLIKQDAWFWRFLVRVSLDCAATLVYICMDA